MKLLIKKKTISYYTYLILFFIAIGDTYIVRIIFNRVAAISRLPISGTLLMYGVFAICYLAKLPEIIRSLIRKKAYDVWFVILLFGISALVAYWNGWTNRIISESDSVMRLILFSIPVFMMARSINDYSELMKHFWVIASPLFLFCIFIVSTDADPNMQQGYANYMTIGYQIGFITAMALNYYFHGSQGKMFRCICLAISLYGIFFVVMYGSRGTLLCLSVYLLLIALQKIRAAADRTQIIIIMICASALLLLWIYSDVLMLTLQSLANRLGMNSRTIAWLLQQDSALDSSGRDSLFAQAWKLIIQNPFGYGILADRALFDMYAHNLFLELMIDFGLFIGGYFSLVIIVRFVKLVRNPHMNQVMWLVVVALVQLMVSSSYIQSGWFWIALGFLMSNGTPSGIPAKRIGRYCI